jgi:hypothetical protein
VLHFARHAALRPTVFWGGSTSVIEFPIEGVAP